MKRFVFVILSLLVVVPGVQAFERTSKNESIQVEEISLAYCTNDTQCTNNEKCMSGRCVSKDTCTFDTDCTFQDICRFGRCTMPECRGGPWDCNPGQRCTRNRCEPDPFARRCFKNTDCRTYERCDMGYCK